MIVLVELLLNCRLQIAEVNLQRLNRLLRQLLLVLQLLVQPLIFLSLGKEIVLLCRNLLGKVACTPPASCIPSYTY